VAKEPGGLEDGGRSAAETGGRPLRADAARNVAQIRHAALAAFRGRGLTTPLAQIAAAAGVSKATIYNHFGGRDGLIDAVIEELVATELRAAMTRARQTDDPWERLHDWVLSRRDLQYREPAFTDVMLGSHPNSQVLPELASQVARMTTETVRSAHASGVLRRDLTAADLFWADAANGLALRELRRPRRSDYDRRTRQFIDSLRPL
jgi:AcrR family transcriptional regulator